MVLVYIDESGITSMKDPNPIFMLGAVIIEDNDLINLEKVTKDFKARICINYNLPNANFEIHLSQLFKKQGKKIFGKQLSSNNLNKIFGEIYDSLVPYNKFKIISSVILKDKLQKKTTSYSVLRWSFENLLERIEFFLSDEYNTPAYVFMDDKNKNQIVEIRDMFKDIILNGTYYVKRFKYINPLIHFLNSASNIGIQLADAITFSIKRYLDMKIYGKTLSRLNKKNEFIFKDLIAPKIRNYPQILGFGLKIKPNINIKI